MSENDKLLAEKEPPSKEPTSTGIVNANATEDPFPGSSSSPQQTAGSSATIAQQQQPIRHVAYHAPAHRVILVPGLEFDPTRRFLHSKAALAASVLLFIGLAMIEIRDCRWSPGIDFRTLKALHFSTMMLSFVFYILSLFNLAQFVFVSRGKSTFASVILFAVFLVAFGLNVWTMYTAAASPCLRPNNLTPIDWRRPPGNVFSRSDSLGIIILSIDAFATISFILATAMFFMRY